jgi:hypothetical protein
LPLANVPQSDLNILDAINRPLADIGMKFAGNCRHMLRALFYPWLMMSPISLPLLLGNVLPMLLPYLLLVSGHSIARRTEFYFYPVLHPSWSPSPISLSL